MKIHTFLKIDYYIFEKNIKKEAVMDNKNEVLIYEDKDGITKVNVKFTDEDCMSTYKKDLQWMMID